MSLSLLTMLLCNPYFSLFSLYLLLIHSLSRSLPRQSYLMIDFQSHFDYLFQQYPFTVTITHEKTPTTISPTSSINRLHPTLFHSRRQGPIYRSDCYDWRNFVFGIRDIPTSNHRIRLENSLKRCRKDRNLLQGWE